MGSFKRIYADVDARVLFEDGLCLDLLPVRGLFLRAGSVGPNAASLRPDRAGFLAVFHGHLLDRRWLGNGVGRLGSFVGPLAIRLLVNRGWQIGDSFVALGVPALCASLVTSLIGINRPRRAAEADSRCCGHRPLATGPRS